MIKDKVGNQKELEKLLRELDGISHDVSSYVNFLVSRETLMQRMMMEDGRSNN